MSEGDATSSTLPVGRVVSAEVHKSCRASQAFCEVMSSAESVFHSMLTEDNIFRHGPMVVADICHCLGKADIGSAQFLPGTDVADVETVQQSLVSSHDSLRGKD